MRAIVETITTTVYNFNELSDNAKEKVKEQYLNGQDAEFFYEDSMTYINELFPNSKLDIQFSLGYCQGDGFNIYGEISFFDLMKNLKDKFTEKEKRFLEWAFNESGINSYTMRMNNHYCYCNAFLHEFTRDVFYELDYYRMKNIKKDILDKFDTEARYYIGHICKEFENDGYDYFYEVSNEELEDWADANGYEFTEDGNIY